MKFSLRKKAFFLVVFIAVILSFTTLLLSNGIITNMVDTNYRQKANELAATIAVVIDGDRVASLQKEIDKIYDSAENKVGSEEWGSPEFNEYISPFSSVEDTEDFKVLMQELRNIQEQNSVDCVYLIYLDPASKKFVYMVDAALEDACPPGCFDPIYDINLGILDDPERGFPAYITNTEEYGWLVTAASPVHDSEGNIAAYAAVDIPMADVKASQTKFMMVTIITLLAVTVIMCGAGILIVSLQIINPIKKISTAASEYQTESNNMMHHSFSDLEIRTGDEIEELSRSMKQMEWDINDHINKLVDTTKKLSETKLEADRMTEAANNDALTGIRNKRAYNIAAERLQAGILAGRTRFGIAMVDLNYLKTINDTYGHDAGDEAIKALCEILCGVFVHSPVFRVGGDEFVVILENNDYEKVNELVDAFNEKIEDRYTDITLPPSKRISAAIGYSLFDPEMDINVTDVFDRADTAMYARKKQMKEMHK